MCVDAGSCHGGRCVLLATGVARCEVDAVLAAAWAGVRVFAECVRVCWLGLVSVWWCVSEQAPCCSLCVWCERWLIVWE